MVDKIFEIKTVHVSTIPRPMQVEIVKEVFTKDDEFRKAYKGFVNITYITASPPKIKSIEPIKGTPREYFKSICPIECSVF